MTPRRMLAAGLALLAFVLAFFLARMPRPEEELDPLYRRRDSWAGKAAEVPPSSPPPPAQPSLMLLSAINPEDLPPGLGFAEFLAVLGSEANKDPAARDAAASFTTEFMAEPTLRQLFHDFDAQDKQGKKPSASRFLGAASSMPEFRRLSGRYATRPATAAIVARLSRHPALSPLMARAAQNARMAQVAPMPLDLFAPAGAHAGARPAPGASRGSGAAGGVASGPVAPRPPPIGGQAGADAHAVDPRLAALRGAGNSLDIRYLASLFVNMPAPARQKLEAACDQRVARNEGCDVVDICLEALVYSDCVRACQGEPKCAALDLFPPTPVLAMAPDTVAVGQQITITITRTAPNASFPMLCSVDGVQGCGAVWSTDARGGVVNTSVVGPERLVGSGRWCVWFVSDGKSSNQVCAQVVAPP